MATVVFSNKEPTRDASKKRPRLSYNSQLTQEQQTALRQFFSTERYPKHADKKMLSEKYKIDPLLVNKWFQGERGRYNKKFKEEKKKNERFSTNEQMCTKGKKRDGELDKHDGEVKFAKRIKSDEFAIATNKVETQSRIEPFISLQNRL